MIGLLAPKFAYGKDFQQQSNKPKQNRNSAVTGNKLYKVKGGKKALLWVTVLDNYPHARH